MAGLGMGLFAFLALALVGLDTVIVLIFLQFSILVAAGYVAGRFAPAAAAANGGLAGMLAFLVMGAVSVASAQAPSTGEFIVLGLIAAILGSAGGALADRRRQPEE